MFIKRLFPEKYNKHCPLTRRLKLLFFFFAFYNFTLEACYAILTYKKKQINVQQTPITYSCLLLGHNFLCMYNETKRYQVRKKRMLIVRHFYYCYMLGTVDRVLPLGRQPTQK